MNYYLASQDDPRYELPSYLTEQPVTIKCELCGDHREEQKTLVLDHQFNYCISCVRKGRLHKHVLNDFPTEEISRTIKLINTFIIKNILL